MKKGITAVIATYNRREPLEVLLDSIIENKIENFEVIIADQNTNGLIDDIVERYSNLLNIRHLKMTEANQSKARNIGASYAEYSIICFPDDDCWYEPDTLKKVLAHFDEASNNTDLLIINWRQHPVQLSKSGAIEEKVLFSFRGVGYGTIVLYFKTAVFRQLGGFKESIGIGQYIGGGEDSELTFRAMSKQMRLHYSKEIGINHLYNPIVKRALQVIRTRQRAMGYLYVKYHVPFWVVIRGLAAPFIKMIWPPAAGQRREFYNICCARIEGLLYGLKSKENRFRSQQQVLEKSQAKAAMIMMGFIPDFLAVAIV